MFLQFSAHIFWPDFVDSSVHCMHSALLVSARGQMCTPTMAPEQTLLGAPPMDNSKTRLDLTIMVVSKQTNLDARRSPVSCCWETAEKIWQVLCTIHGFPGASHVMFFDMLICGTHGLAGLHGHI